MSKLPPKSQQPFRDLPSEVEDRRRILTEHFGRWLFAIRNTSINASQQLVDDSTARQKLGTIRRQTYESVAGLSKEEQKVAMTLAKETLDGFLERLLWALGDEGVDCHFDDKHAYRYRIDTELVDISTGAVIERQPVNRGEVFFGKNWGRWLNRFSARGD